MNSNRQQIHLVFDFAGPGKTSPKTLYIQCHFTWKNCQGERNSCSAQASSPASSDCPALYLLDDKVWFRVLRQMAIKSSKRPETGQVNGKWGYVHQAERNCRPDIAKHHGVRPIPPGCPALLEGTGWSLDSTRLNRPSVHGSLKIRRHQSAARIIATTNGKASSLDNTSVPPAAWYCHGQSLPRPFVRKIEVERKRWSIRSPSKPVATVMLDNMSDMMVKLASSTVSG